MGESSVREGPEQLKDVNQYDFHEIAPYEGQDFLDAAQRLHDSSYFTKNLAASITRLGFVRERRLSSRIAKDLPRLLLEVQNYNEFQKRIFTPYVLEPVEKYTMDSFSVDGLEALDPAKSYVFISNHRDIILDCALLDFALIRDARFEPCEMCFGDNLMVNQFSTDFFKCTGGITVKRSLPSREALENVKILSAYIQYALHVKNKCVWIAQKTGRAKDGRDDTSTAILKMLCHDPLREQGMSIPEALKSLNIVPVAISYQYDPCDISKGREQVRKLRAQGVYSKPKYADVVDMLNGIRMNKGQVHISIGSPLGADYESYADCAREIDRQIHMNYRLYDTNYFSYDYVRSTEIYKDMYADMKTAAFLKRYNNLSEKVRLNILNCYANPVRSYKEELAMLIREKA